MIGDITGKRRLPMSALNAFKRHDARRRAARLTPVLQNNDAGDNAVKSFIRSAYARCYGADIREFPPCLISFMDERGGLQAAVGYRAASAGALFLEQYLQHPVEVVLGRRLAHEAPREDIVEIGSLACRPGGMRDAVAGATVLLKDIGFQWAVFTATTMLHNSCLRLGFEPVVLGEARRELLHDSEAEWGSYYETRPRIIACDIGRSFTCLGGAGDAGIQHRAVCNAR